MITDEMVGVKPGTRVLLKAQPAQDGAPALPAQHAEYLGDGMFEVDEENRLPGDRDGLVEGPLKGDFTVLE